MPIVFARAIEMHSMNFIDLVRTRKETAVRNSPLETLILSLSLALFARENDASELAS